MQKKTHTIFALLLFLIVYHYFRVSPVLALFVSFGAYFPDIDYLIDKKYFPSFLKNLTWKPLFKRGMHRTLLHNVWMLLLFSFIFWKLSGSTLFAAIFGLGYLSHLVMDSFTKTGIHWLWPLGDKKIFRKEMFHIKGNMITGSLSERMLQIVLTLIVILVVIRWTLKF